MEVASVYLDHIDHYEEKAGQGVSLDYKSISDCDAVQSGCWIVVAGKQGSMPDWFGSNVVNNGNIGFRRCFGGGFNGSARFYG